MLFDVKTLDLRLPHTRAMDRVGDAIVGTVRDALHLSALNGFRTAAMHEPEVPGTVRITLLHSLLIDLVKTNEVLVQFSLTRDARRRAGSAWEIQFLIFNDSLGYTRQRRRVEAAIRQFVATQEHLTEPNFEFRSTGTCLDVKLTATIGHIVEPADA